MKKTYVHLASAFNFRNMNSIYSLLLILVTFGCNSERLSNQNTIAALETKDLVAPATNANVSPFVIVEPYELKLELNPLENEMYDFVIRMQLNDGSYYVSPNAKRDFKGKFSVLINDTGILQPISKLQETPLSVEEYDPHPFVKGNVNWVRENTTYNQIFQRTLDKDFIIFGMIQFTIEPRCTLEKTPFSIKYANGEMKVAIDGC